MAQWQPTGSIETLRQRAEIIHAIRDFFRARNVLEVETPALSRYSVTDQHLHPFVCDYVGPAHANGKQLFLQTSPEYAMKRLIAAGSGCIYQIAKAFRNEGTGRHHNPEFTMLEWYRIGYDDTQLMAEVEQLIRLICDCPAADYISYQQVFIQYLALDPLTASVIELQQLAIEQGFEQLAEQLDDKDSLLQLLFSFCIEPNIGQSAPCLVFDFPASQASLARLSNTDPRVAKRFEVYYRGIELANGFQELTCANEQRHRFQQDQLKRQQQGLTCPPIDPQFLQALAYGLPDCAGVALGVDRLIMLALDKPKIADVLSFNAENA